MKFLVFNTQSNITYFQCVTCQFFKSYQRLIGIFKSYQRLIGIFKSYQRLIGIFKSYQRLIGITVNRYIYVIYDNNFEMELYNSIRKRAKQLLDAQNVLRYHCAKLKSTHVLLNITHTRLSQNTSRHQLVKYFKQEQMHLLQESLAGGIKQRMSVKQPIQIGAVIQLASADCCC
ncbi:Hypothetical_protein [Hexamita inflata]|uniref:Hypothetical_protein n=1 Tax=Hexamita inflata TaxID=28002 RepID=A0AA86N7I0_9EUKA|nr:Hypothetical protein HINF_LOCUS1504 [Hexamita inflata]